MIVIVYNIKSNLLDNTTKTVYHSNSVTLLPTNTSDTHSFKQQHTSTHWGIHISSVSDIPKSNENAHHPPKSSPIRWTNLRFRLVTPNGRKVEGRFWGTGTDHQPSIFWRITSKGKNLNIKMSWYWLPSKSILGAIENTPTLASNSYIWSSIAYTTRLNKTKQQQKNRLPV